MSASVGSPPSITRAGASACTTASQARQAYLGRRTTSTRSCAGTMSRRSEASSPMRCRRLRQQGQRSEEHTSELQSRQYLVCRLLLEKKKKILQSIYYSLDLTSLVKNPIHRTGHLCSCLLDC